METVFNRIKTELLAAADQNEAKGTSEFINLLDRIGREVRVLRHAAMLSEFGSQFKSAGEPVDDPDAVHQFKCGQPVRTKEGYRGYIVGHDAKGQVIVNVVWQACEYAEADLSAIPGPDVLESMKEG